MKLALTIVFAAVQLAAFTVCACCAIGRLKNRSLQGPEVRRGVTEKLKQQWR
jgi:hypothetical protein